MLFIVFVLLKIVITCRNHFLIKHDITYLIFDFINQKLFMSIDILFKDSIIIFTFICI